MAIRFQCPKCGKPFNTPDELAGKRAQCKDCGAILRIPVPAESAAPTASLPPPLPRAPQDPLASLLEEELAAGPALAGGGALLAAAPGTASGLPLAPVRRSSGNVFWTGSRPTPLGWAAGGLVVFLFCVLIFAVAPLAMLSALGLLAWALLVVGLALAVIGGWWTVFQAFGEDVLCGLLILIVPLYNLYYIVTRWPETKRPFLLQAVGAAIMLVALPLQCGVFAATLATLLGRGDEHRQVTLSP